MSWVQDRGMRLSVALCQTCRSQLLGRMLRHPLVQQARGVRTPAKRNSFGEAQKPNLPALPDRPFLKTRDRMIQCINALDGDPISPGVSQIRSKKWLVPTVLDKDLIDQLIDHAGLHIFEGKTILEMNPGPGLLAERILQGVKPKRYIALEPRRAFTEALSTLPSLVPEDQDTKIVIKDSDGFHWSSYSALEEENVLIEDELVHDRAEINPNLVFIGTPKTNQTEQLVAQWLDTLGTNSWLQKYGRVRMYLFIPRLLKQKLLAPPGSPNRYKGTFIREATCTIREVSHSPFIQKHMHKDRLVFQEVFDDGQDADAVIVRPDQVFPWTPMALLEVNPLVERTVKARWETFEYIVKTLMMNKSTPLHRQIRTVASGAYVILASLPPDLRKKWPQDMTTHEMDLIAQAFDAWPFRPKFFDVITANLPDDQRSKKYGGILRSRATSDLNGSDFDLTGAIMDAEAMTDEEATEVDN